MNDRSGSAFPVLTEGSEHFDASPGMTLRDYFAGQALVGILSGTMLPALSKAFPDSDKGTETVAGAAYEQADAMLAERERKP